jgi:hypothetical protein
MGNDAAMDLGARVSAPLSGHSLCWPRHSPCEPAPAVPGGPPAPGHAAPASGTSPFARLLRGVGDEIDRGESLVQGALGLANGKTGSVGAELIALQVGVYRYGEALDLAARLVDRATGSVKSVLQGQ